MMFLKLTRSAKSFVTRFGWLIAELIFVFLGLYGAFLLERMHDEEMDQMRKRQILQALVDEFTEYEKELTSASSTLDEGHGVPFFTAYAGGERPFPTPIPFGSMASVNTGIWEAMLQSGGIEVLEVEHIQKVQVFFKKLQDLRANQARDRDPMGGPPPRAPRAREARLARRKAARGARKPRPPLPLPTLRWHQCKVINYRKQSRQSVY